MICASSFSRERTLLITSSKGCSKAFVSRSNSFAARSRDCTKRASQMQSAASATAAIHGVQINESTAAHTVTAPTMRGS